jgi:hypothetical protein
MKYIFIVNLFEDIYVDIIFINLIKFKKFDLSQI